MPGRPPVHYDGDLRAALLDAAAAEIADHGTADVSLRAIARRAGVSHAAPAHHFRDKAGLFTALALRGFQELGAALAAAAGGDHPRPEDRLRAAGLAYLDFALERPALFEVMWRPALQDAADPALRAGGQAALGVLVGLVAQAQAEGWAPGRDPFVVAVLAWTAIHGLAVLWRDGPLAEELPGGAPGDLAEQVARVLIDALAA